MLIAIMAFGMSAFAQDETRIVIRQMGQSELFLKTITTPRPMNIHQGTKPSSVFNSTMGSIEFSEEETDEFPFLVTIQRGTHTMVNANGENVGVIQSTEDVKFIYTSERIMTTSDYNIYYSGK